MRLETFPLIVGAIIGLFGLLLLLDAWIPDNVIVPEERRLRPRLERNRFGESLVGFGVLAMAAAFVGRDTWRYSIVVVIGGSVLLLWGAKLNSGYLRELFVRSDRKQPKFEEGSRRVR